MFDNDEYSFKPFDKEEYEQFEKQQADQARSSGSAGYAEIADKLMALITQHGNERLDEGCFNENEEKKNIAINNGLKLRWEIEKIIRKQFSA